VTGERNYGFEELLAWQRAMELVDMTYDVTEAWPKREMFGLSNQVRRAAVSVPSNIAEGLGRKSRGDFHRFLSIAYGSLMEVRTQLLIAQRRGFSAAQNIAPLLSKLDETGRLINGLKRSLDGKPKDRSDTALDTDN
jgi:four helix bundle protein